MRSIKLKIADIVIKLRSCLKMEPLNATESMRYKNFIYRGRRDADIVLDIDAQESDHFIERKERIFITVHPLTNETNWTLFKYDDKYIIEQCVSQKRLCTILNNIFTKGIVYLLSVTKGDIWKLEDIIYDLLQIILINYISQRDGLFIHSIGLKDIDGAGLLFAGKTQSGKSTTAQLWYRYSRAKVLNDDRIIVRKTDGRFFIHGSPWHGDFRDYLVSCIDSAPLRKLFFIYHAKKNTVKRLSNKEAFHLLYPTLFPTFWDKASLKNVIAFCQELIEKVPSYHFGFVDDKRVIKFVRNMKG